MLLVLWFEYLWVQLKQTTAQAMHKKEYAFWRIFGVNRIDLSAGTLVLSIDSLKTL